MTEEEEVKEVEEEVNDEQVETMENEPGEQEADVPVVTEAPTTEAPLPPPSEPTEAPPAVTEAPTTTTQNILSQNTTIAE